MSKLNALPTRRLSARVVLGAAMAVCATHAVAGDKYKPDGEFVVNMAGNNTTVTNSQGQQFVVGKPVAFGVTPPIRDLPPEMRQAPASPKDEDERIENERVKLPDPSKGHRDQPFMDPLVLAELARGPRPSAMPAPSLTFAGIGNPTGCGGCLPPDTNGDVGPNHYVQAVNTRVNIYSKTGTAWASGAVLQSAAFFTGLPAGNSCRNSDDGDPIVLYDSLADRWLVSQFEINDVPGHQCIAISQTPDPTGAWYAYDFVMPNTDFQDYPHYGVWPDGYYLTTNQFNQAGTAFLGAGIFAFDRMKMLAGDPTASYVYHDVYANDQGAGGMLPTDVDGFVPPPAGLPNRVMEFRSNDFGDPADGIRTYELVPNYATPASSTFTIRSDVLLAEFDARAPNSRNVNEQAGGSALDTISDRLMFRLAYRNLGSVAAPVNSWVGNFTVNVSGVNPTTAATYQAGIRWFELRSTDSSSLQTVRDQGTHANGAGNGTGLNNWMGSAAQDSQGNIALGYSQSGPTQNANIMIAARTGGAPTGAMNEGEAVFQAAGGWQTSTSGRWGDYSAMSVDPVDDCTFWYTQEYYTANGSSTWQTRIGKFVLPTCTPPARGFISATITNCATAAPIAGASVSLGGGLFRSTKADGTLASNFGVAPGSYTATVTAPNYGPATSGTLTVTNGNTTNFALCLNGQPVMAASPPVSITAEDAVPPNNAVDPGETVTVSLPLINTGSANTTNLVATLQPSASVLNPSAAQTYGAVLAGGPAVAKSYTFTAAGTCGNSITLTLALQDGASNLGTVSFTVPLGTTVTSTALDEKFDGVTAPALPAGWTTAISGSATAWATSSTNPSSAPNAVFAGDPTSVSDNQLISPSFAVPAGGGQLTFRNLYNMETGASTGYDGVVLELSIDGGPYSDITTGGNAFLSGGYVRAISASFSSPIAGRQAWTGLSGGTTGAPTYITSSINLPASAAGHNVQLKWRAATDTSAAASGAPGARIDDVKVSLNTPVCSVPPNHAPNGNADSIAVNQGASATLLVGGASSVLANDVDVDGNALTAQLVTGPTHGSLTLNTDGTFSYANDNSANNSDSFVYKACDNGSPSLCSANVTVSITVNLKPVAGCTVPGQLLTEGQSVSLALAGMFTDPEATALTYSASSLPGGLSISAAGQVTGTVSAGAAGSSPYTVGVTATDAGGAASTRNLVMQVLATGELVFRNGFDDPADAVTCH